MGQLIYLKTLTRAPLSQALHCSIHWSGSGVWPAIIIKLFNASLYRRMQSCTNTYTKDGPKIACTPHSRNTRLCCICPYRCVCVDELVRGATTGSVCAICGHTYIALHSCMSFKAGQFAISAHFHSASTHTQSLIHPISSDL